MRVAVCNLGCKVNQYECDAIVRELFERGIEVEEGLVPADFYILNTCAVTREAERKSRQFIARVKRLNPRAEIAVCGCASQKSPSDFAAKDGVVYVSGTAGKSTLLDDLASRATALNVRELPTEYEENPVPMAQRTRFYVKIQDGCDNFCSYCVIPYLRGRSRSRAPEKVVAECEALVGQGVKELVITGINLSAYDAAPSGLAGLLSKLRHIDARIRLGSLEACVVDEKLLAAAASLKNFCPHFHLSLQSGDDKVLADMNRHYTAQAFLEQVEAIRRVYPDAAITTDLICGFPTEDDEAFSRSLEFCRRAEFADMHIFPYSPREGTAAEKRYKNRAENLGERVERAERLAEKMRGEYIRRFIGKPLSVLFEEEKDGFLSGHSENYIRVYAAADRYEKGAVCNVVARGIHKDGLITED